MNAADGLKDLESATKMATAIAAFRREFPEVKSSLHPWRNDPLARELADPESLDVGFNFPTGQTLVQMRFHGDRLIGIEAVCFGLFNNQRWHFSTIADWRFVGSTVPFQNFRLKFKKVCRELFDIFNSSADFNKAS